MAPSATQSFSALLTHRVQGRSLEQLSFIGIFAGTGGLSAAIRHIGLDAVGIDHVVAKRALAPVLHLDLSTEDGKVLMWDMLGPVLPSFTSALPVARHHVPVTLPMGAHRPSGPIGSLMVVPTSPALTWLESPLPTRCTISVAPSWPFAANRASSAPFRTHHAHSHGRPATSVVRFGRGPRHSSRSIFTPACSALHGARPPSSLPTTPASNAWAACVMINTHMSRGVVSDPAGPLPLRWHTRPSYVVPGPKPAKTSS